MSNNKIIYLKKEDAEEVNIKLAQARNYRKQSKILESYSLFKLVYRKFNLEGILPEMINAVMIANKQNLLKNKVLKYKLIMNLIDYSLKKSHEKNIINKLISWKLNLYRNNELFKEYYKYYSSVDLTSKKNLDIKFEYLHYLIEIEKFDEAEIELSYIKKEYQLEIQENKAFNGLNNFILDKNTCLSIANDNKNIENFVENSVTKTKINSNFKYIIVVTGNYFIFKNEIFKLIASLNNSSDEFMLFILIHDANDQQKIKILSKIESLNIDNFEIKFENTKNLSDIENKTFYASRRFVLAKDLLKFHNSPIFTVDADTVICKNLLDFINENNFSDMSLTIKKNNKNFKNMISAGYALFFPTKNSEAFLNFFNNLLYTIVINKNLVWFTDQIALLSSYIFLKRIHNPIINNNLSNNHKNPNSFFYHTLHNRYEMKN